MKERMVFCILTMYMIKSTEKVGNRNDKDSMGRGFGWWWFKEWEKHDKKDKRQTADVYKFESYFKSKLLMIFVHSSNLDILWMRMQY